MKKKRDSQASYTSDMMESESDFRELEMNMDIIDEYYYGVRIFPGQDPSQVLTAVINGAFTVGVGKGEKKVAGEHERYPTLWVMESGGRALDSGGETSEFDTILVFRHSV